MSNRTLCCTAFVGAEIVASGSLEEVALAVKQRLRQDPTLAPLVFDDTTGRPIDLDLRGTDAAVVRRLDDHPVHGAKPTVRTPGRPKLGVVAREVTLLPRHWGWLNAQPGGASVALRKLVEDARRANEGKDRVRRSQEAAYRFMSVMAGNRPGFEEATRALFARHRERFERLIEPWPRDVRNHARKLATAALDADTQAQTRS